MLTPQILSLIGGTYYTAVYHAHTEKGSAEQKTLYKHYQQDPAMMRYLPSKMAKGR